MFAIFVKPLSALVTSRIMHFQGSKSDQTSFVLCPLFPEQGQRKKPAPIKIDSVEFVIGRGSGCDLRVSDPFVSQLHCVLVREGDELFVEERDSKNGVFVNFKRIEHRQKLQTGDYLEVGASAMKLQSKPEFGIRRV